MNVFKSSQQSIAQRWLASLSVILVWLWAPQAFAQVDITASAATPNASYTTLKGAFDAINAGTHQGLIGIGISADTSETASAVLNASGVGAAVYTSIGISPTGGAARTISGAIVAGSPLVDLNGADNVTIDGLNSGGNALTISNLDTGAASTLRLIGDASNNLITRVSILGSGTAPTAGTLVFSTATSTGNDGNTLSNCTIGAAGSTFPVNGVLSMGSASPAENSANTISNCNIANFFSASAISTGVLIGAGNDSWTINDNRLFQTAPRTYTTANTHSGIQISSGSGHTVSGNVIGFANSAGTGIYTMQGAIATRLIGINLAVGTVSPTSVQGNRISGISLNTSSGANTINGALCGINITSGNADIGTVAPNTIGAASGAGSLSVVSTTNGALLVGINSASTGTLNIQGNVIGGLASSGISAAIAGSITGINVSGAATAMTITGNTVGNATADNMRGGTSGVTTASSLVSGINLPSTPAAVSITNNSIQNLSSFGSGTTGVVRGIGSAGATGNLTAFTISGNTITNLVSDNANTSIINGIGGAVGINLGIGSSSTISNNTISNIARTNTGTTGGWAAGITHANATNTTIARNRIFDIRNANTSVSATTPGIAAGIVIRSGTTALTIVNNMISLGSSQVTNTSFIGIQANHGSTPDPIDQIYFNTINITGAAASGAQPSFGFLRGDLSATARTIPVDFRNNIITNNRSGGTGAHYAIANNFGATVSATGWGANASNFNVLNANTATVGHWGGNQTFSGWQSAAVSDDRSYSGIAVTYLNAANDLHLNMGLTPTTLESAGTAIAGITTDFDTQIRPGPAGSVNGGAVAPDLGADEFDGVILDVAKPIITYSSLANTTQTANRSLSATITDATGVATGGLAPRIYYRKNAGAYFSQACSLSSGTVTNGVWTCLTNNANVGGVVTTDVIGYFVIAQDSLGNVSSSPTGVVATNVNTVTTPPVPNTYTIVAAVSPVVNVGPAETITSLTNAGGVFERINNGVLTANVVVSITGNLTAETGTFALNPWLEEGVGGYTLLIRPSGGPRTVSGSNTGALIRFNGTDRVTLDGSNSGGTATAIGGNAALRELTVQNTNTGTSAVVIAVQSGVAGAQNNTIRNVNVLGQDPTTTLVGIALGGATPGTGGTDNDGNRIENCSVRRAIFGLYSSGQNAANPNFGTVLTMNDLSATAAERIRRVGLLVFFETGVQITLNSIGALDTNESADAIGIALGIQGLDTTITNPPGGITNALVSRNRINGVNSQSASGFSAAGISVAGASGAANVIVNNMITGITAPATSPDLVAGIFVAGVTGSSTRLLSNSISMTGDRGAAATQTPSYAVAITGTNPTVELKNNAFATTQIASGGGVNARSYAIGMVSTTFSNLDANYNAYFSSGANAGFFRSGSLEAAAGTDYATVALWGAAVSDDANSLQVDPLVVSTTDLHLQATSTLIGAGTPIAGVTVDFDGQTRSATTPAIGADEVEADLGITKTDGVTTATPGTSTTYTITASNAGPSNTTATVADTFPASCTSVTWSCTGAGGGLCTAAGSGNLSDAVTLPSGGSVSYTASCAISAAATGTLSNTATVSSAIADPTPGNNSATDTDTLVPTADLGISKTDGVTSVVAGGNTTYIIVASNVGPSNVSATVADTFPAVLSCTWTCVGAGGGTCTAAGSGNINDSVGLPSGASTTYTASCAISSAATGTLVNTATVSTSSVDPTPGNNSATDTNTVVNSAFSINDVSVNEGNAGSTAFSFTVSRSDTTVAQSVDAASIAGGSATVGTDYTALGSTTLNFGVGIATQTVNVQVIADTIFETNETFNVGLSNATGGASISDASGIGTITNDDTAPTLAIDDVSITEGNSGTQNLVFTVTRTGLTDLPASFTAATADGTATAAIDYSAALVGSRTIAAGGLTNNTTLTATINGDAAVEANETFFVNLSAAGGATILDNQGIGTITNDDTSGVVVVQSGGATNITEGGATDSYTLVLASQPTADVSIALNPDTQVTVATSPVVFTAANWNIAKTLTVSAVDDVVVEGNHTGTISHVVTSADTVYNAFTVANVVANITDNDAASLSINDVTIVEGNAGIANAVFTVTRSSSATAFAVDVGTGGGTATAGVDYTSVSTTLNFSAGGALTQTLNVPIIGDTAIELNETFNVTLSNPTNGTTLSDATGVGTVSNDDVPNLSVGSVTVAENAGPAIVRISVSSAALVGPVTGTYSTADGSATAPSDYSAQTAIAFSIPANGSFVDVAIPLNNDGSFEPTESFTVSVAAVTGAAVTGSLGTITITDDDQQPTTTTIVSDLPDPSVVGQSYAVNVQVAGTSASPTGTVNVSDGAVACAITLAAATSPNSLGTCNLTSTTAGSKTLSATYVPASTAFGASTITTTHQVNAAATTLSLIGPATIALNQPASYSFTLAVTAPGAGVPAGLLTVQSGAQNCQITLPSASTSCAISFTSVGQKAISASFAPSNSDFGASNSAVNVNTLVFARSDLSVTKTDGVSSYRPNDLLVYTITVRNNGVDAAPQVRLIDVVPASLDNVAWTCVSSGGAICPASGGVGSISQLYPNLPANSQLVYTLSGGVNGSPASIINTATVQLPNDGTVVATTPANLSATDTNLLDFLFANGFEDQSINAASGGFTLPSDALRSVLDATAVQVFSLSDSNGEALRVYARVLAGVQEFALATRDASGRWTLGAWQRFDAEPRLSWTATSLGSGFVLISATLR